MTSSPSSELISFLCRPINSSSSSSFDFIVWDSNATDFSPCFSALVVVPTPPLLLFLVALLSCCVRQSFPPSSSSSSSFRPSVLRWILRPLLVLFLLLRPAVLYFLSGVEDLTPALVVGAVVAAFALTASVGVILRRCPPGTPLVAYLTWFGSGVVLLRSGVRDYDAAESWAEPNNLAAALLCAYGVAVVVDVYVACVSCGRRKWKRRRIRRRRSFEETRAIAINESPDAGERAPLLRAGRAEGYLTLPLARDDDDEDGALVSSSSTIKAEDTTTFGYLVFSWLHPLLRRGQSLDNLDDVFHLPEDIDLRRIDQRMSTEFAKKRSAAPILTGVAENDADVSDRKGRRFTSTPNFLRVFFRIFGLQFLFLGLLRFLCYCVLQLLGPLAQNLLLSWMQQPESESSSIFSPTSRLRGAAFGALLCFGELSSAFFYTHYHYFARKLSIKIRSSLCVLVFRKLLRLKTPSRSKFTSGTTLNLMSTDVNRIESAVYFFHDVWITPLLVIQIFYLLYLLLGWAFLACVGFMVLAAPLGHFMASGWYKFGDQNMSQKDKRIKMIREVLTGIKVIKFQSWEESFKRKITEIRDLELKFLKKIKVYDGCAFVFFNVTPSVMAFLTIVAYSLLGGQLTAARIFTAISLILALVEPLLMIPIAAGVLIEAKVSYDRLKKFFALLEEEEEEGEEEEEETLVSIEEADFSWDIDDGVDYKEINKEGDKEKEKEKKEKKKDDERKDEGELTDQALPSSNFLNASTQNNENTSTADEIQGPATSDDNEISVTSNGTENPVDSHVIEKPVISNISFSLKPGELVGVIGVVGSGKSSLLAALLGDLTICSGRVSWSRKWRERTVCVLPQEPWLQQVSIKENILFGRAFDPDWFDAVVAACQLAEDVAEFPAGVDTEVGENGVTLSGGQKARVALARAVYANADVYVIDDPFAAVDPAVAEKLFRQCVVGVLKNKTRVLCTHHGKFLRSADRIVVMEKGRIARVGEPEEIFDAALLDAVESSHRERLKSAADAAADEPASGNDKLVEEETKMVGFVDPKVYWAYLSYTGRAVGAFIVLCVALLYLFVRGMDIWMTVWINNTHPYPNATVTNDTRVEARRVEEDVNVTAWKTDDNSFAATTATTPWIPLREASDNLTFYLGVYCAFFVCQFATSCVLTFVFIRAGIQSARGIHSALLERIMAAPLRFFTATPVGRIINRFSSDLADIDDHLANLFSMLLQDVFNLLMAMVVICYGFPWLVLALVPAFLLYFVFQLIYRRTSRELKRIESITKSPIFSHFSDCLNGAVVIRAMRDERRFVTTSLARIEAKARAEFNSYAVSGWLEIYLGFANFLVIGGVALSAVLRGQTGAAGFVGLTITYALQVSWLANSVVQHFTWLEKMMVGVERILEYSTKTPLEEDEDETFDDASVPESWPDRGVVAFNGVTLRYRADLEPALEDVSFETAPAEKVGIVGRTGSGKSSLFNVLFRVETLEGGRVVIDGVDASRISRRLLRSRLAVIPQDPYVFSGTVRENLVVDSAFDDGPTDTAHLWSALKKCHLEERVTELGGLDAPVAEGGSCFSVGQKQLLCLARAVVKRTRILCIDEATANVDFETDKRIQETIRTEFKECTVLTIAHRPETLADSDRILEMSKGKVKSLAPPLVKM